MDMRKGIMIKKDYKDPNNYIFFWGGIFSNFYSIDGPSVTSEKWFMLQKAQYFKDKEIFYKILDSTTPGKCKRLGKKVKGFNEEEWCKIKANCMMMALKMKFFQCKEFREELLKTEDKILVEASPHDRIWGIGYSEDEALENYNNWGENLLGKCLMFTRTIYSF